MEAPTASQEAPKNKAEKTPPFPPPSQKFQPVETILPASEPAVANEAADAPATDAKAKEDAKPHRFRDFLNRFRRNKESSKPEEPASETEEEAKEKEETLTDEDKRDIFGRFAFPTSDVLPYHTADEIDAWFKKSGISESDLAHLSYISKQQTAYPGATGFSQEEKQRAYDISSRLKNFAFQEESASQAEDSKPESEEKGKERKPFLKNFSEKAKAFIEKRGPAWAKNFLEARDVEKRAKSNDVFSNREDLIQKLNENAQALAYKNAELLAAESNLSRENQALKEAEKARKLRLELAGEIEELKTMSADDEEATVEAVSEKKPHLEADVARLKIEKAALEEKDRDLNTAIRADNENLRGLVEGEVKRIETITGYEGKVANAEAIKNAIAEERAKVSKLQAKIGAYQSTIDRGGYKSAQVSVLQQRIKEMGGELAEMGGKLSQAEVVHAELIKSLGVIKTRLDAVRSVAGKIGVPPQQPVKAKPAEASIAPKKEEKPVPAPEPTPVPEPAPAPETVTPPEPEPASEEPDEPAPEEPEASVVPSPEEIADSMWQSAKEAEEKRRAEDFARKVKAVEDRLSTLSKKPGELTLGMINSWGQLVTGSLDKMPNKRTVKDKQRELRKELNLVKNIKLSSMGNKQTALKHMTAILTTLKS